MNELNGKDYNSPKARPTTLAEIWGMKLDTYKTQDEEVYRESLRVMNVADLYTECLRLKEHPKEDRGRMVDMLMKLFRKHVNANKSARVVAKPVAPDLERAARAKRVIADMTGTAMVY